MDIDIIYRSVYNGGVNEKNPMRETIIEKALLLFSSRGYEGVSVSELAESSGITKPTLYYYFGNKEGLFEAVSQSQYEGLDKVLKENAAYAPNPKSYYDDIYRTLIKVVSAYFSFAREHEPFFRMTLANLAMPPSSPVFGIVKKYHFSQFDIMENMFREMAKGHGNLKGKSRTLSWSFIGTINSYIGLFFSGMPGQALNDKAVDELVHQFMHGIYA